MTFDPRKAERRVPRDKGTTQSRRTLDCTLKVDETLIVNFRFGVVSDNDRGGSGMTEEKVRFLWDSLVIARKALKEAVSVVSLLKSTAQSTDAIDDCWYDSLRYHYGLDTLADRKNLTAWQTDLQTIGRVLEASSGYLCTNPVTVGDALSRRIKGCFYKFTRGMVDRQNEVNVDGASRGYVNLKKQAWGAIDEDPTLYDKWKDGRHAFGGPEQFGNIKLDFRELADGTHTRLLIASTLIHEATHKMGNTVDHAYAGPLYEPLTKAQRLNNADSHAWAAICLYKKTLITKAGDIPSLVRRLIGFNPNE